MNGHVSEGIQLKILLDSFLVNLPSIFLCILLSMRLLFAELMWKQKAPLNFFFLDMGINRMQMLCCNSQALYCYFLPPILIFFGEQWVFSTLEYCLQVIFESFSNRGESCGIVQSFHFCGVFSWRIFDILCKLFVIFDHPYSYNNIFCPF